MFLTFEKLACSADKYMIQAITQEVEVCAVILEIIHLCNGLPRSRLYYIAHTVYYYASPLYTFQRPLHIRDVTI